MNNKEFYCLYRSQQLNESTGMTLRQGWEQADREWKRCECVPQNIDHREDEEYDDMEYDECVDFVKIIP